MTNSLDSIRATIRILTANERGILKGLKRQRRNQARLRAKLDESTAAARVHLESFVKASFGLNGNVPAIRTMEALDRKSQAALLKVPNITRQAFYTTESIMALEKEKATNDKKLAEARDRRDHLYSEMDKARKR